MNVFHITIFSRNTKNRKNRRPPDVDGHMMYIRTYVCRYNTYICLRLICIHLSKYMGMAQKHISIIMHYGIR